MRTSLPAQESADLSSEGRLEALPDLSDAADKLLNCLMPSEVSEDTIASKLTMLRAKRTTASINWRRHSNAFSAQRELYGGESYIDPSTALKSLLGTKQISDAPSSPWRPDALFQKANLAILASSIFSTSQEQDDHFTEELDRAFPKSFTEALVSSDKILPGHSMLVVDTFQYALEVRTQHAITLLSRYSTQPSFDSDTILHQEFYKDVDFLKGWGIAGLLSEDLTDDFQRAILKRLHKLREAFTVSPDNALAGIERLRATFGWNSFVYKTIDWISQRLEEIEGEIVSNGGKEIICQNLSNQVQRLGSRKASTNNPNNNGNDHLIFDYEQPSKASISVKGQQNVAPKASSFKLLKMGKFK